MNERSLKRVKRLILLLATVLLAQVWVYTRNRREFRVPLRSW